MGEGRMLRTDIYGASEMEKQKEYPGKIAPLSFASDTQGKAAIKIPPLSSFWVCVRTFLSRIAYMRCV